MKGLLFLILAVSGMAMGDVPIGKFVIDVEFPQGIIRDEFTIMLDEEQRLQGVYCYPGHFCCPMYEIEYEDKYNMVIFHFDLDEGGGPKKITVRINFLDDNRFIGGLYIASDIGWDEYLVKGFRLE